jgi:hypothetical protein
VQDGLNENLMWAEMLASGLCWSGLSWAECGLGRVWAGLSAGWANCGLG